ncbi:MAG TPA: terminase [Burkholderiaceae bacterium]
MNIPELLRWQWSTYPANHTTRANLLIHIVVVPLFLLGNVGLVLALLQGSLWPGIASAAAMLVSMALQGRGHKLEALPPEPFTGPLIVIGRIFFEQWLTFPRFVLSGAWWRALRQR